jgi:hypothetical protein
MPRRTIRGRTFDTRPDRVDYRDRPYRPRLVSLPEQFPSDELITEHFEEYASRLVLDQGEEGACTGFGLAAIVNYLQWRHSLETRESVACVSPRMLYQMALLYDEWPGEDYEGSSCRGAMKGWFHHGVCSERKWPYRTSRSGRMNPPVNGWLEDAAQRPLGAYYRVDKRSLVDMQSAIVEVGAIYVSSDVHNGWFLKSARELPIIELQAGETGGHAFAIVGYTPQGFVVQNSWGPDWGYHGFAVLTYRDWFEHGTDAWVAVLGAPVDIGQTRLPRTRSRVGLHELTQSQHRAATVRPATAIIDAPDTSPLSPEAAYELTAVLGNDGQPINQFLHLETATEAVAEVAFRLPRDWLQSRTTPRIAIYAHGGLNSENASIDRIRRLAPYFLANDIYPLFLTWRTGFLESVESILNDIAGEWAAAAESQLAAGWLDRIGDMLAEAKDRTIEVACERLLVKPVWSQMKQNAAAGTTPGGGLALIARHLTSLRREFRNLELSLIGHSAGSILLGHLLTRLAGRVPVSTCSLYAPACTVPFALRHFVPPVEQRVLAKENLCCDILTDERERADSVGPYGKSLLYLVSRALEDVHKTPLLGMEAAWPRGPRIEDQWHRSFDDDLKRWHKFVGRDMRPKCHGAERANVWDGVEMIPLAHGSFDNDIAVVEATLRRIRGGKLFAPVTNLHGF